MLTRTGLKLEYQQTARTAARHPVSLLCVFRNEHLLLQYFISYYRALGIERFIMIDNLSDDGGPEYLRSVPDINISLYRSEQSYREAEYGTQWLNDLLQEHCRDQYCLVVDADELFAFDTRRYSSLSDLVEAMEGANANALATNLVDMYPREIGELYVRGADFRDHSPYFDDLNPKYFGQHRPIYGTFFHKVGGMRKRVFDTAVCIHNFPFFRYDFYPIGLAPGRHYFQRNGEILRSSDQIRLLPHPAVLLHFKFLKPDFRSFVMGRIRNNQDWNDSSEYHAYLRYLDDTGSLRLFDQKYSRRLEHIDDLEKFFDASADPQDASTQTSQPRSPLTR